METRFYFVSIFWGADHFGCFIFYPFSPMRIDEDIKLDYSDVLLRPKRSTLTSCKDVSLEREFVFYHSPKVWK
jgi:hypothetical protein